MKLGPIDVTLPGIFEIEVEPQGEWVRNVKPHVRFHPTVVSKKRIEENRWHHSLLFVDRLSPDLPYFYEQLFCEAVEEISSIEVPPRARAIRNIPRSAECAGKRADVPCAHRPLPLTHAVFSFFHGAIAKNCSISSRAHFWRTRGNPALFRATAGLRATSRTDSSSGWSRS